MSHTVFHKIDILIHKKMTRGNFREHFLISFESISIHLYI